KKRLTEQYNIPAGKITTIYNAIESELNSNKPIKNRRHREKIVTFLGRITIQKGPEYFVNVARMVIHRMKNVHFVMAGNGELRNKIIELCARYGITDRFHFTGFLNGCEVTEMLHRSDLFIMPSVSEPFGIVPLEAMQANVPVIISLQSGVSELIRNVVKTDFWDVQAMADAVHSILKHKKLSKTLITEGKLEVSKLNWEFSARQIRQVYLNTLFNAAS
ncbi:MAG TPA: glycosyltransferase family 4 protein, partial [Prolixibacteraceae bacterium]